MKKTTFFAPPPKKTTSGLLAFHAPTPEKQIDAVLKNKNWVVLNLSWLQHSKVDDVLCQAANALKHTLQTYGPTNKEHLRDLRPNKGSARGSVFHAHIKDSTRNEYVIEWEVLDEGQKIMALRGFGSHENYSFKQAPMNEAAKILELQKPENLKTITKAEDQKKALTSKYGAVEEPMPAKARR